ncbi:MAG TPA: phosphoribosyltransferase family protein [Edaphocola sp.]|nr:phosphoribosyltransferase family protein [Edaphocola sp.]
MTSKVSILNQEQIGQRIKRMAYEIWEKHSKEEEIVILGIADGGAVLAESLKNVLTKVSPLKVKLETFSMDKEHPLSSEIKLKNEVLGKNVVLVDDVANSGKTLLYAMKPLLTSVPKSIQLVVLVDRKHKQYPIVPDVIGYSVATTLQEHISVSWDGKKLTGAYLE